MEDDKKNVVSVKIGGNIVELVGVESREYIFNLAQYINKKIDEIQKLTKSVATNSVMMKLLVSINIADDLFKEREINKQTLEQLSKLQKENETLNQTLNEKLLNLENLEEENLKLKEHIEALKGKLQEKEKEFDEYIEEFGKN